MLTIAYQGGEGVWKNYDYVIYVYRRGVYIFEHWVSKCYNLKKY